METIFKDMIKKYNLRRIEHKGKELVRFGESLLENKDDLEFLKSYKAEILNVLKQMEAEKKAGR